MAISLLQCGISVALTARFILLGLQFSIVAQIIPRTARFDSHVPQSFRIILRARRSLELLHALDPKPTFVIDVAGPMSERGGQLAQEQIYKYRSGW